MKSLLGTLVEAFVCRSVGSRAVGFRRHRLAGRSVVDVLPEVDFFITGVGHDRSKSREKKTESVKRV